MKKNILLLLLSAGLLTGCEFDITLQRFFGKGDNEPMEQQSENNEEKELPEDNKENEKPETDPVGPTEPETPVDPVQPVDPVTPVEPENGQITATIPFCGSEFSSVTSGKAGYVFADHPDVLQNYCATMLDATNMLSGITFENLNTAMYKNELYLSVGTGYYANGKFKEGLFKWTSLLPLHKVVIKARAYSKLDTGGSTDIQSVVWIDNNSCSLECASDVDPVSKTLSVDYENGTQTFSIKSTGSRVMLESLTITWSYIYGAD